MIRLKHYKVTYSVHDIVVNEEGRREGGKEGRRKGRKRDRQWRKRVGKKKINTQPLIDFIHIHVIVSRVMSNGIITLHTVLNKYVISIKNILYS